MSSTSPLPLPPLPRMPFSSPIDEELSSSSLSTFLNPRAAPATPPRGREGEVKGSGNSYDRVGPTKQKTKDNAMNVRSPVERKWDSSRPRLPELNLVTNFTRPTGPSYNPAYKGNAEIPSYQQSRPAMGFVWGKEASGGRGSTREQSLQSNRSLSRKHKTPDGIKGPVGSLKRASDKITQLSPSDRTLVIGISIPSSRLAEHVSSPESASTEPRGLSAQQHAQDRRSPVTPDIIITPAMADVSRLAPPNSNNPWTRRRATSSVYSQATRYTRGVSIVANEPPLPPFPLPATTYAQPKDFNEKVDEDIKSRITSWGTDFEEDDDSHAPPSRPASGESQLKMLNRSSVDTVATRHRSQGWWNQILSPFLTRSNTLMSRTSPTYDEPHPALPSIMNKQDPYILEPKTFVTRLNRSTSESEVDRRSGHTSIWTDLSRWDAERRTLLIAHPDKNELNLDASPQLQHDTFEESSNIEQILGFRAAAEYYEACLHDEYSPTPFFKCENHECPSKQAPIRILQNSDEKRGLVESPEELSPYAAGGLTQRGTPYQAPSNSYSAIPREARGLDARPKSDVTEIEEDIFATPEGTPAVHEVSAAPVVRARPPVATSRQTKPNESETANKDDQSTGPRSTQASSQQLPPYSPPREEKPTRRYRAVLPPDHPRLVPEPSTSLEATVSRSTEPGIHRTMPEDDEIPLVDIPRDDGQHRIQNTYHIHQYFGTTPNDQPGKASSSTDLFPPPKPQSRSTTKFQEKIETNERSDRSNPNSKESKWSHLNDCFERVRPQNKKKRRCLYCWIISGLVSMIILTLVLAMTLTRKRPDIPIQSSWLNITGFPPIPTGVSTVAQPDAVVEASGCVQPPTMWSCALPKEQQASIKPNSPDQPNFRIEIRFDNSTTTKITNSTQMGKRSDAVSGSTMSTKKIIRDRILHVRDSFTNSLFIPNPAPPSQEDQKFLGNTTDKNAEPFDGESTSFYISFLATTPFSTKLRKRQQQNTTNTTNPFPDLTGLIPPPDVNLNGTAAAANLLPFPSSQPIRLFNRGLTTEHYGFYSYFDRSIFLRSSALIDLNSTLVGEVPDDENGGAEEEAATVRCTWAQTRFLVQIWTNLGNTATLLPPSNTSQPTSTTNPSSPLTQTSNATISSANDFSRPGSFPYPISITMDRHGGDISKKEIYCYGVDEREHIITNEKKIQLEERGLQGTLVNPAEGPFGNVNVSTSEGGPGGIDGGSGGCQCQWKNWETAG